jgi:hypothetical protein
MSKFDMISHNQREAGVQLVGNCKVATKQMNHVDVGSYKHNSVSSHTVVTLPYITNKVLIKRGTELVIEVDPVKQDKRKDTMTTWKDDTKRTAKQKKQKHSEGELQPSIELI